MGNIRKHHINRIKRTVEFLLSLPLPAKTTPHGQQLFAIITISAEALLASAAGDEADHMDTVAAGAGKPLHHDLENAALAVYINDGGVDEDQDNRQSTLASFIKTSSADRSHGRSFLYLTDDDNLSIPARYARPSSCISKQSFCEALLGRAAGVEGQELEEEGPALAGCDTDEDHEDDRHAPASTSSTRAPTPRARCRGGSISSTEEEEDNDDKGNLSTSRDSRPSSCSSTTAPSSHEAQSQLAVPAPTFLADEPEEAEDEAGADGAREFLGGGFGQAEAEEAEAEAESDLWSSLDLEPAYPEDTETTPGNGHVIVNADDGAVKVDGVVRRLPGRTSTSTPTPSSTAKWNGTGTGTGVPPAAPPSSSSHPRPRPAASPSPRLSTIGVSSFSSKLQLARSRTTGRRKKSGYNDCGNAIVYIDDTAMVVDCAGADGEGGVVHVHGSRCKGVGFGALLDGDDDDNGVEVVVVEVDGKEGASGSAGAGHSEDELADEGLPGARKRDTAPESESECEVVANDRQLNHTNDLSWGAGTSSTDDDDAGTDWGGKLKGGVDVDPNASVVAANSCDEESADDSSSDGDSSEDDSSHEGKHAQLDNTTLIVLLPLQQPADDNHDGGSENKIVDDDEGNEIEVRVTNAKEDGESDTGSRGAGNLEVEVERDSGRAAAGALDHADELSGREGEHGEAINQKYNIEEDEAGDLDASNGFVDDDAGFGGRADYTNDDETAAEPPAEGDIENTVDNGGGSGDDKRVGDITAPDIDEEDGDSCSRNRGAEDPNLGKIPTKSSSTPNSDDEILRLRQALENEQKTSTRLRVELKAQTKNHINLLARLGLRTSIVRRQEHHLRVDQQADTQNLQTALRALQDEIDREVEACMCGAQREPGFEGGEYGVGAVELEKNWNGKRRLPEEDENQEEEDGVDDLGEPQGSENFSVEEPLRSRFKRARIE